MQRARVSFPLRRRARRLGVLAGVLLAACGESSIAPPPTRYASGGLHLAIEIATDDLVHFEYSTGDEPIATSPMVARTQYPGPTQFSNDGHGRLATATLALAVDPQSLCITFTDRRTQSTTPLTVLCPATAEDGSSALTLTPEATEQLYGLGEHFLAPNQLNGDLLGTTIGPGNDFGNAITSFNGGNTGHAQFPVLYAVGPAGRSYALFVDQQYAQTWNLAGDPWQVSLAGGARRGYFLAGRDPLAVRRQYMDLVGHPPVPPKKLFGLWVSEFGYDNWGELEDKLRTLRANAFPVDGFLLDLQWFGGVFRRPSQIGSLSFDAKNFPDAAGEIVRLREQQGIGLMPIEEPYVDASQPVYADLAARGDFPLACDGCLPVDFNTWWGHGSMLDFTSEAAGDYWHDTKRQALTELGVLGHWTDLGEPETFSAAARYGGFPALGLHGERDVHNLYNFDWAASIARGYARHANAARPFILSRSGTSGIARFGAAMWSGDIGGNMGSLATQLNVQMHMSFSGMDYFGSDVGGYFRAAADGDPKELYTQWFADSALLDVPLRPHTENLCNCYETAPDRVGDPASNLENLRLRYRLIPYRYTLAHRAYRFGEPTVAPLVMYYPDDRTVRTMSDEKLLGRDLLVATVSAYGQTERDVYLPAGTWIDFRTQQWLDSGGEWIVAVPIRPGGRLQLPLYARAGAIIPMMFVDEQTMNALGQRLDGSTRDELIVRVYADAHRTGFTLYEDDGTTTAYRHGAVRTTAISQQQEGGVVTVAIAPATGGYADAPSRRDTVVELATRDLSAAGPQKVTLNGRPLPAADSLADFEQGDAGWYSAGDGLLRLRSGAMDVSLPKTFEVRLRR